MLGFLKSIQSKLSGVPERETWNLDRNWHHAEAERHLKAGNLIEAERNLVAAVEDADKRELAAGIRVQLRLALAEVQRRLGVPATDGSGEARPDIAKLRDAENILRNAAVIAVQNSDTAHYLDCMDALADVLTAMENYPALEEVAQEAVRLSASAPREDAWKREVRIRRLALAQDKNGRFEEALITFDKAIALREQSQGARHEETGNLIAEAGRLCRQHGEHGKAQEYLRRALRVHEAACGDDSIQAFRDVQELAGSLEDSGDQEGAAAQYERALMLKQRKLGIGNIDEVAEMQYTLAALYATWGNLSRARELLEGCIGTFQRTGGVRLAVAYETLAQIEERSGRVSFAVRELGKASVVWEKCGASRRRELAQNLEYQADLLDQLRQRREANWLRKRAAELTMDVEGETAEARGA